MTTTRRLRAGATALLLCAGTALAACGSGGDADADPTPTLRTPPTPDTPSSTPTGSGKYADAFSATREDSVYPEIGDPLVDALHYDLGLEWDPSRDVLTGTQVLTFRATADSPTIPLDFNEQLAISELTVDGTPAGHAVEGTRLTVEHPVEADHQYELALTYSGTPRTAPAPSERQDFAQGVGWSITPEHETWTLQEPYGAFTWYAVNDQPADKAFYDFTLTSPAPLQGVANGELRKSTKGGGRTTNTWHLAEPASSYLVTVAFGDYQRTDLESASGVPIQIWTDADEEPLPGGLGTTPDAVDWLEDLLGPYPFDSLGIVVVDGSSGMETQTMITLGNNDYSLSPAVVVHEVAHHWYGNTVSPADWSDVWMNEGMAMYLQGMWEAEQEGIHIGQKMDDWAMFEARLREDAGPPGAFDPKKFGNSNIYYGPALMWHELREDVGDEVFFDLVREWPASQENGNADRTEYLAWIEDTLDEELSDFFDAWLLGEQQPPRD
ncbi:Aminopeptidase N [Nocardioides sp. J9]|uniref:M1 family metallopeptidase n=1 Tax=Nocardioides sp. J9 TaxID=935844 RepID=UPI0011AD4CC1|nr:M1 family metallopeptidase [Nocardioides sp. J9]TWH00793.1 Aminopeptidase N [Nocardioides sp. J9]